MKNFLLNSVLISGLFVSICSHAADNEKQILLKKYHNEIELSLNQCTSSLKYAFISAELSKSPIDLKRSYECISDGKISIKKAYEAVIYTIEKTAAKTALKEHYIGAVSALQGIQFHDDERKINYEKRQSDNKVKVDELWLRFEIEN